MKDLKGRSHKDRPHKRGNNMKVKHIPTNIILEIEKARNIKHLFGKIWYDQDYKSFLIGDKKRLDKTPKV